MTCTCEHLKTKRRQRRQFPPAASGVLPLFSLSHRKLGEAKARMRMEWCNSCRAIVFLFSKLHQQDVMKLDINRWQMLVLNKFIGIHSWGWGYRWGWLLATDFKLLFDKVLKIYRVDTWSISYGFAIGCHKLIENKCLKRNSPSIAHSWILQLSLHNQTVQRIGKILYLT